MRRATLWTWISAAVLGVGLTSTAGADPGDRDRESARMRMQDLQQRVARHESAMGRPDSGKSISGRDMGRDTITPGAIGREFKDRNQMTASMNTQTTMRAARTAQAQGTEDGVQGKGFPNVDRPVSNPSAVATSMEQNAKVSKALVEPGDAKTAHEKEITEKTVTGKQIGRDTYSIADSHRNFKSRDEMMSQLNTQTVMRAGRTLAAEGGEEGSDHAFVNAGRSDMSNPDRLSDAARAGLAKAGFVNAAKRQVSSDVEDKTP